jgi:hypothetical protein
MVIIPALPVALGLEIEKTPVVSLMSLLPLSSIDIRHLS